jgi:hypothetical protein
MNAQRELRYTCSAQWVPDEGGGSRKAWRLRVTDADGQLLRAVDDVCCSESRAAELEALLARNRVSPKHIIDVLEDWLT